MSLVDVVDEVLDALEQDEQLRFTLDGQLATVDDYLEIRPENEGRVRALVTAGRLAIGPWQTLVDEFLVDGETIVRNLETGLARAAAARRDDARRVPAGHVRPRRPDAADPPPRDRDRVVWRGVPSAVDFHRFVWESPDGSSVVAEYLPAATATPRTRRRTRGARGALPAVVRRDDILGMVGTDHMPLVRDLARRRRRRHARGVPRRRDLPTG
jgi:alpha-mannosidase